MRAVFILGFGLVAVGCGVSKDDFCGEMAAAQCEASKKCCTEKAIDEAACKSQWTALCQGFLIGPVNAGNATYDGAAATECLSQARAAGASCSGASSSFSGAAPACSKVVAGKLKEGASCEGQLGACEPGLTCYGTSSGGGAITFKCAREAKAGESCEMANCEDDLYCDFNQPQTCKARAAVGSACGGAGGAQCVEEAYCESALCVAQKSGGAACSRSDQCLSSGCEMNTCKAKENEYCRLPLMSGP